MIALKAEVFHSAAQRHARFYLQQLQFAHQYYHEQHVETALARFDEHWFQINSAFQWLSQHSDVGDAIYLSNAFVHFGIPLVAVRRSIQEQITWLTQGLAAAQQLNDQQNELDCLNRLGQAFLTSKSGDVGLEFYEQALALARKTGNEKQEADALVGLGRAISMYRPNQTDIARTYLLQASVIYRALHDLPGLGWSLHNLGSVEDRWGDSYEAEAHIKEGLTLFERVGDQRRIATAHRRLGSIIDKRGDATGALLHMQTALNIAITIDDMEVIPSSLLTIGLLKDKLGDHSAAKIMFDDALAYSYKSGNKLNIGLALMNLGWVATHLGDFEAALTYHLQSLDVYRRLNHNLRIAAALTNAGFLQIHFHMHDEAAQNLLEALTITREIGTLHDWLDNLLGFAWLNLRRGNVEQAAQIIGKARANPPDPMYAEREAFLSMVPPELEAALAPDVLEAAMNAGKTLDVEILIQQVLQQYKPLRLQGGN